MLVRGIFFLVSFDHGEQPPLLCYERRLTLTLLSAVDMVVVESLLLLQPNSNRLAVGRGLRRRCISKSSHNIFTDKDNIMSCTYILVD